MQNYITMSQLTMSEGFGSQMGNFAALYAVAQRSGHRVVFFDHWVGGKGLKLPVPFEPLPMEVLSLAAVPADAPVMTIHIDPVVAVDSRVFALDEDVNYDFQNLFHSYRYWHSRRQEIFDMFRFRQEIRREAATQIAAVDARGREIVSVHVRRTDFLEVDHLHNLSLDYYSRAFAQFRGDNYAFLVFSDDMAWCREKFARRPNVYFAAPASDYADMCAMSMCAHNIVANSAFSGWGARLNGNPRKKVVCPEQYMKNDRLYPFVNHCWYPDDWVALEDWQG